MKFRKDGKVFDNINDARIEVCKGKDCSICPVSKYNNGKGDNCANFCDDNPKKAAELMGYEVIEADAPKYKPGDVVRIIGNANKHGYFVGELVKIEKANIEDGVFAGSYWCEPRLSSIAGYIVRETDMEKAEAHIGENVSVGDDHGPARNVPRICETLGVDMKFQTKELPLDISSLSLGWAQNYCNVRRDSCGDGPCAADCELDKRQMCMKSVAEWELRRVRLTPEELEICRLLGAKWVSRDKIDAQRVDFWMEKPEKNLSCCYAGHDIGCTLAEKMPSVEPGDCINVEELLKDA